MYESPHGFFHLDHPAEGAPVPAGAVRVRGWAAALRGLPFVDVRFRADGKIYSAHHGFPRADLSVHFGLRQPFLPAGFEADLPLRAGQHVIACEALTLAGDWHEIGSFGLTVQGSANLSPAPSAPKLEPREFARLLHIVLRRAHDRPVETSAREAAALLPDPRALRYPHRPFHGHLNEPARLERVLFGQLALHGWLFHETAPIQRMTATVDLQTWQDLERAEPIAEVATRFATFPHAQHCAYAGLIDVPAQLPMPLSVRTYAELSDGSWQLCHIRPVHGWDQEEEKQSFAPFSPSVLLRSVIALHGACRARGFTPPALRSLWPDLRETYWKYRARARRTVAAPRHVSSARPVPATPRQVTLISHNLAHEGASLFLYELARAWTAAGIRLHLISTQDGPLAANYAALGVNVQVIDTGEITAAATIPALHRAMDRLATTLRLKESDLVVANTLVSFWGVHLARQAGRPSLFYIHESTTPAAFFLGHRAEATLPLVEATFQLATHVSFLTETTRVYYRPWLASANHSLNPGWIEVAAIDAYLAKHPREQLRAALGLSPHTHLIINVGSVCDRKGQHLFARSVDLLWRLAPELAETCRFVMVGGRDTSFARGLARQLKQLDRPNLEVVPTTADPLAYYGAADLLVCSSFEESFPRVILEAMACRVPILSTAVHGVRDLLTHGHTGWLVPAGDTHALAEGLRQVLTHPTETQQWADQARRRVETEFSSDIILPRHTALATAVSAALS